MSNIDRYRPPREGYQPPSLPPKPMPAAIDRLSNSPSRRRDVPPAVPSPPTLSSRTSPPRPQSRRSAPSPSQPSPQHDPQPRPDQWFFTHDEVLSTPSIIEGLSPAEDQLRRAKGVNFIYQAGIMLELPQITLWVAGVFFHRFYMRYSMIEEKGGIHHYNIAATALFLANKTEENCRKTKDLIIAVAKVAQKNPRLVIDEQSKEYWKWRDSILAYEELMLETLTFDLMVDNPYAKLYEYVGQLGLLHNKALRDSVWAFCNDACLTTLPLVQSARDIALAALFFASCVTDHKIDDVNGEPWYQHLGASEANMTRAVEVMADFYKDNPLRKAHPNVPGSPQFVLESTRRRGELSLSQMDLDSSQYGTPTPLDIDRGATQSPRPTGAGSATRANGRAEQQRETSDSKDVAIKSEESSSEALSTIKVKIDAPLSSEGAASSSAAAELSSSSYVPGDSDAALKAAANDLSIHDGGSSSALNGSADGGGGLVSPLVRQRSEEPEEGEEREAKRAKVEEDEDEDGDEGEIKGS